MNPIDQLVARLEMFNRAYRSGHPLVSDAEYDRLVEQLRAIDPQHPYLSAVEPEKFAGRSEIRHPQPMLSTEKAYTDEQLARFVNRAQKEAQAIGIQNILFRMTPKLDGLAGRDDGRVFASRGNGFVGYEISSVFAKGVIPIGGRGQGLGEIVVVKSYFDANLADKFEHPRNMVVGIVSSDTLNADARMALEDGMVHFVPYSQLQDWQGNSQELLAQVDNLSAQLAEQIDYPMDGVVIEVVDERLKAQMGATAHHYRWQIAVKRKGDTAETTVQGVQWQVGRSGNITPVMEVMPVSLSGATIRRVTAHHAGIIARMQIGPGARIEIIRSGEVIPKLERVLLPSQQVRLPQACPACSAPLVWRKGSQDFLQCTNSKCPAQTEQRIIHWFRMLGNADWFGAKTVEKLVHGGYDTIEKVYQMRAEDFAVMGFGPVQSKNLHDALQTSLNKPVEDWRFLAAFGIEHLGLGDSRRLLQHFPLIALPSVKEEDLMKIKGFGKEKSPAIVERLAHIRPTFEYMLALGFELIKTPLISQTPAASSPIGGKHLVFTGKMQKGNREEMQAQARQLGALVQTSVSRNTDLLICGDNVGRSKIDKAALFGVKIISEEAYYHLIAEK